jgi:hypothetical protein
MATHLLTNAEIGTPDNMTSFATDYKTKRNEILS